MDAVIGQPRAVELLQAALRSGRFHHAWIFSGPRGVGKFTAAMAIARILLDPGDSTPQDHSLFGGGQQPSDKNEARSKVQRLIDAGIHPDLHIIRKELARYSSNPQLRLRKLQNIPVDLLRERMIGGRSGEVCHDAAAYRSAAMGHGKVFIIDEAELMARESQNCLLKTLEEPPPQTYFFLITSQPQRLLATIHSRCQHVRFGRLDAGAMQTWIKRAMAQGGDEMYGDEISEFKQLSPAVLKWIEEFAEGSPGVALLAAEYGFHQWQKTLDPMLGQLERGEYPPAMGDALAAMVEEFAVAWVKRHGQKTTSKDAANKDGARHVFALLAAHARRRLAASCAQREDAERWSAVIDLIRDAETQLESNVNPKLLLENLVVQWSTSVALQPSFLL